MKSSLSKLTRIIPPSVLEKLVPSKLFARLDIASKMLSGYMVLVLLTVVVVVYALVSLQNLNRLNSSIVNVDVPVQESSDRMRAAIIAQDTYEKRYLILNSPEQRKVALQRGEEFRKELDSTRQYTERDYPAFKDVSQLYKEYSDLFDKELKLVRSGRHGEATRLSNGPLKRKAEQIDKTLADISRSAKVARDEKTKKISTIGRVAFVMTAVLSCLSVLIGIIGSMAVTHHISSSIEKLTVATSYIAEGNFDYDPHIKTNDEIGNLASAFVDMGKRLKKLEEMYLDASPLTRLPGGIAIENVLKKRIDSGQPLAFCLVDLDNFKSYNDRYGYAQGSELLKETARIAENAIRAKGTKEDFVGHIGGDDFVVITVPPRMRSICEEIIAEFDRRIPDFYDEADRKNGYIMGKSRQGVEMRFPLITISVAIVTNERRQISSPLEASEIAAELKDYAKTIPKSVYVIDKRRTI